MKNQNKPNKILIYGFFATAALCLLFLILFLYSESYAKEKEKFQQLKGQYQKLSRVNDNLPGLMQRKKELSAKLKKKEKSAPREKSAYSLGERIKESMRHYRLQIEQYQFYRQDKLSLLEFKGHSRLADFFAYFKEKLLVSPRAQLLYLDYSLTRRKDVRFTIRFKAD